MLIGIMADTHDHLPNAEAAVSRLNGEKVDLVLHAGDYIAPFVIHRLAALDAPMVGVFGNNDGDRDLIRHKCAEHPRMDLRGNFAEIEVGGLKIALLHGHETGLLDAIVASGGWDVVVHGHTHQAEVSETGKTLVINPGEVCGYLTGKATVALFEAGKREAEIVLL